jgi:DnaJ family protein C protein 22
LDAEIKGEDISFKMTDKSDTEPLYPSLKNLSNHEDNRSTVTEPKEEVRSRKSLCTAYILWLFGGFFGLHHLYLGRDSHAFIYYITCGAYFGMGWIRDLWKLPEYVRDANEDPGFMKSLNDSMRRHPQPQTSWVRNVGYIIVADILGYLIIGAIPIEFIPNFERRLMIGALVPLGIAYGIWLVGNVGRHEGSMTPALIGSYLMSPIFLWYPNSVFFCSLTSYWSFQKWGLKWRKNYEPPKGLFKRLLIWIICISLYSSLWTSWLFFNCTIDKDGEEVKCRDAAKNFLNSPFWREFKTVMRDLWNYIQHHGISGVWEELISAIDPTGEAGALRSLNLTESATQEDITSQYRKLARLHHPDRHKDAKSKEEAAEKFMEISQAYEILSQIKHKRMKRSKTSEPEPSSDPKHSFGKPRNSPNREEL